MTDKSKAPASSKRPEPTPFEKMTDLTRRIINVPKSEAIVKPKKALRKHR
jgi:hypothetical protein